MNIYCTLCHDRKKTFINKVIKKNNCIKIQEDWRSFEIGGRALIYNYSKNRDFDKLFLA